MNGSVTPWYPAQRLRCEMNRMFDEVFGDFFGSTGWGQPFLPDTGLRSHVMPALNIWEDADSVFIESEVPGMRMEDLELTVSGNELMIRGERKGYDQEGVTYHRRERQAGTFSRVVRLPVEIDAARVQARLEHGVLTITCPKAERARPRRIELKALTG